MDNKAKLRELLRKRNTSQTADSVAKGRSQFSNVTNFPEYQELNAQFSWLDELQMPNPYFRSNEGVINNRTTIDGREYINFSAYNYLGLSGDARVNEAAVAALMKYGTSVSASRIASGERPVHGALEAKLAEFLGTEDSLVFVSGHATNVTVIGHLMRPKDLIVYDELAHSCIIDGNQLSGARRIAFRHNDPADCERVLKAHRNDYERVLIAVEGVYSMDGDVAELREFVQLKKTYDALLLVDEAHSIGTLGATGRGIGEHLEIARNDVDIWMGTMSKSLASCGGYIAGSKELVRYLRYTAPGFIFSAGMPAASAAAALKSLEIIEGEPERVTRLHELSEHFLRRVSQAGFDVGLSNGTPIVPIIIGENKRTLMAADQLVQLGINVQPILAPGVPDQMTRLRFFITSEHTVEQLERTIEALSQIQL